MSRLIRPRTVAVAAAAGLVLAATAGGVGYAAASGGSNVSACVGSKARLAVQSTKGKCPKHTKKVSIAKSGPRGATGARGAAGAKGATGARGAQGPGAVKMNQILLGNGGTGTPATVGGLTYTPSCTASGTGAARTVTATLKIAGASGTTTYLRGVQHGGGSTGNLSTEGVDISGATATVTFNANNNQASVEYLPSVVVLNGNTVQLLNMRIVANPNSGGFIEVPCGFEGVIVPTS